MRLSVSEHTERPWRIHAIAPDFEIEDVWALPTPGGPEDFPRLVELFARTTGHEHSSSRLTRLLFALRWKLGELFGSDDAPGPSLRDRVPEELRGSAPDAGPFHALYLSEDEWALELANKTMHGVLHLGWVGDHAQMAVLVKRNGRMSTLYMAAIKPFRHLIVYPALLKDLDRRWVPAARRPAVATTVPSA